MKIWAKTEEYKEGKYLVLRRDGTVPEWPHFVIGGDDPNGPAGLRAYADEAEKNGLDPEYVASIRELAEDFQKRVDAKKGKSDPDAPPHRKDNPLILSMMRRERDLTSSPMTIAQARGLAAQAWCKETTSDKAMDEVLAEEFAKILLEYTKGNQA